MLGRGAVSGYFSAVLFVVISDSPVGDLRNDRLCFFVCSFYSPMDFVIAGTILPQRGEMLNFMGLGRKKDLIAEANQVYVEIFQLCCKVISPQTLVFAMVLLFFKVTSLIKHLQSEKHFS